MAHPKPTGKTAKPKDITSLPFTEAEIRSPRSAQQAYNIALAIWARGNQALAESALAAYRRQYPSDARLAFFQAACTRSRFEVREATPLFESLVASAPPDSVEANCSRLMLTVDRRQGGMKTLADLSRIAFRNPTDPLPLWMLAVACRTLDQNGIGIAAYRTMLHHIDGVGPSLVHQTFANLLDEQRMYQESLPHRMLAVRLEPSYWSYNGLCDTLLSMGRYADSANMAERATRLYPNYENTWVIWGLALEGMNKPEEALKKFQKAISLDRQDRSAWEEAARMLDTLGRSAEAIKYRQQASVLPQ